MKLSNRGGFPRPPALESFIGVEEHGIQALGLQGHGFSS